MYDAQLVLVTHGPLPPVPRAQSLKVANEAQLPVGVLGKFGRFDMGGLGDATPLGADEPVAAGCCPELPPLEAGR
jgi:hypothetical protein